MNAKELRDVAEELFSKRCMLLSLWQDISENFYPSRADFTLRREIGEEFGRNLMTSYPVMVQRDLANTLGSMLRPTSQDWFHFRTANVNVDKDVEARQWLEWAEATQRRAMYDLSAQFTRATKEGDHDYSAFGQCAISVELIPAINSLLYRCWHLRDMAWAENQYGAIGQVFRKWKTTVRTLVRTFPGKVSQSVVTAASKSPFEEIECMHMVVEADMYDLKVNTPYISIYYDCRNDQVLEAVGVYDLIYVIPRWQTVSGSQYAYSPATIAGLPEARLLQAMTATLLEAGEKMTNPPMVATQEAIRSDISIYAGGITWVDAAYDERLGEVLRPLTQDKSGMPLGMEMQKDSRAVLMECFYLNKFGMPDRGSAEMTAFEVGQRVQEYIRGALPIFEPMEQDYNGQMCEMTFNRLQRAGTFGDPRNMPRALRGGAEVEFEFVSPLHDAIESQKTQKFMEMKTVIAEAVAVDQEAIDAIDVTEALRDALLATIPAGWVSTEAEIEMKKGKRKEAAAMQASLAAMEQASMVAKNTGDAAKSFSQAQAPV